MENKNNTTADEEMNAGISGAIPPEEEVSQEDINDVPENISTDIDSEPQPEDDIDDFDDFSDDVIGSEKTEQAEEANEEETVEDTEPASFEVPGIEKAAKEKKKREIHIPWKAVGIGGGILVGIAAVVYFGGAIYYNSHFYAGTTLRGFDCSNLTVDEAKSKIINDVENYTYTIYERGGKEEYINGEDIELQCTTLEGINEAKEKQSPFKWFFDRENKKQSLEIGVSYNEDKLYSIAEYLDCAVESREGLEGASQRVYYENGAYHVNDETDKNIINFELFYSALKAGIYGMYQDMSLEGEGLYTTISQEERIKQAVETMNQYVSANITYTKGDETFVVNGDVISQWITLDDTDYSVNLSSGAISNYVDNLAGSCNTVGTQRNFVTSYGNSITVGGGDYGWKVNRSSEIETLTNNIKNGETVEREPIYSQTAQVQGANNDFLNTYVEVNLSAQHLWYYKDGALIVSTDFVSGNVSKGYNTHTGVYKLKYKERNATLKGEGYSTPVSYWMPFNNGEGLHDANWRSSFGGSIYLTNGSHGCVNLPPSAAATIYENIQSGTPVIVF